jgi:alpha-glucosidase
MELTSEQSTIDWTAARRDRPIWKPFSRPKNIFAGTTEWQVSQLDNVQVLRLSVLPDGQSCIPSSFTVISDLNWLPQEASNLPLDLNWQQSKLGRFDLYFKLPLSSKCFALGERFNALDLRGGKHTILSTDNPNHDESSDSLYIALPFLIVWDGNKFTGLYVDSAAPMRFDLDREMTGEGHLEILTKRGFRIYLFSANKIQELVSVFTSLVGRTPLPPLWSLGHQQSRWSYHDEPTVRKLAQDYREHKIPCDTIVLDIDYMEDYKVFTTSEERFPNFKKMISALADANFKVVTIVDPGVKEDLNYDVFSEGKKQNLFCKTPDGKLFIEKVWPGESAFPDFLKSETRAWWAERQRFLTSDGVAGIWNDMNEPAFFGVKQILAPDADEMPPNDQQLCLHETPDGTVPHLEVRNLYGLLMSQAANEGLRKDRPNERPFVQTRSGCAGIQRYAAVWLGDNKSWFEQLRKSVPMMLNMGLSGVPFTGVDIGGFWHHTDAELLVRWYELGIFYPFFRNHCALGFRAQEPFSFVPAVEKLITNLIEQRYRMLPYLRNLFWEHTRTGAPPWRPMFWHFPKDPIAFDIDDQFMFGSDILVAPILERGRDYRSVYFPEGSWYHFGSKQRFEGGKTQMLKMPWGEVPAFVRDGAIVPLSEPMQHTGEYFEKPTTFHIFGSKASCQHFEDDGITRDFENGVYNEYQLNFESGALRASSIHSGFKSRGKYFVQPHDSDKAVPVTIT